MHDDARESTISKCCGVRRQQLCRQAEQEKNDADDVCVGKRYCEELALPLGAGQNELLDDRS